MKNIIILIFSVLLSFVGTGCKKFLDKKSNQQLSTFRTVADLQSLLDEQYRNYNFFPSAPEVGSDNLTITNDAYNSMIFEERNRFIWAPANVFHSESNIEWSYVYDIVNIANVVLDNADKVQRDGQNEANWNTLVGHAYFMRGYSFLKAADVWCKAYDTDSSSTDLGLPLRLNSNFHEPSVRSTVEETFMQIESDLVKSAALLPNYNINPLRPSKPAAFGALARCYLQMGKFEKARDYADSSLRIRNELMDFNITGTEIRPAQTYPFIRQNREVVFDAGSDGSGVALYVGKTDTMLYKSYSDDDLRKTLFYRRENDSTAMFRGTYLGGPYFSGITTAEMLLIRAECFARLGQLSFAVNDINHLLEHRYRTGTYFQFASGDQQHVLDYILEHRRKELAFRMLRWSDIKRLNRLGYEIVQKRVVNGIEIVLPPNDPRYAMAIPERVIRISGMPQNPR